MVYLCLAEAGKTTAQRISKNCNIPRTTVYYVLENLVKRGLVFEEQKKGTTFFSPNKPSSIVNLIRKEKEEIVLKESMAGQLVDLLTPYFKGKLFNVPTIQFFEGKKRVEDMLYEYLDEWHQSMLETDNIWWGYHDYDFIVQHRRWLESYWKMKDRSQEILLFSNRSEEERTLKIPNRTVRPLPKAVQFRSTFWICGAYIVVLMQKNKPQYAFQIKDEVLATNLKVIFRLLWHSPFSSEQSFQNNKNKENS